MRTVNAATPAGDSRESTARTDSTVSSRSALSACSPAVPVPSAAICTRSYSPPDASTNARGSATWTSTAGCS